MSFLFKKRDYEEFLGGRDESAHVLMEVTCQLSAPVICDAAGGLHLDSIMAFGAFIGLPRKEREELPPMNAPWSGEFSLPLSVWTAPNPGGVELDPRMLADGDVWGWCASDNLTPWEHRARTHVRGPTATRTMLRYGNKRRVNVAVGEFKPVNIPYGTYWPADGELRWLTHGNPTEALRLLKNVESIGKRHNTGHGNISLTPDLTPAWSVTPLGGEWSHKDEFGNLIRRIPAKPGAPARLSTVRAPYHHRSRQMPARGPGC